MQTGRVPYDYDVTRPMLCGEIIASLKSQGHRSDVNHDFSTTLSGLIQARGRHLSVSRFGRLPEKEVTFYSISTMGLTRGDATFWSDDLLLPQKGRVPDST